MRVSEMMALATVLAKMEPEELRALDAMRKGIRRELKKGVELTVKSPGAYVPCDYSGCHTLSERMTLFAQSNPGRKLSLGQLHRKLSDARWSPAITAIANYCNGAGKLKQHPLYEKVSYGIYRTK